jgi:hypothetical protein
MGEAKRRKQLDQTYGLAYQVTSSQDMSRHVGRLFRDFYQQWGELIATDNNFDEITTRLVDRMQQQLSSFKPQDREVVANALMTMYMESGRDFLESLLLEDNPEECIPNLQEYSSNTPINLISPLPQEIHLQNQDILTPQDKAATWVIFIRCLIKVLEPWLYEDIKREVNQFMGEV